MCFSLVTVDNTYNHVIFIIIVTIFYIPYNIYIYIYVSMICTHGPYTYIYIYIPDVAEGRYIHLELNAGNGQREYKPCMISSCAYARAYFDVCTR